LLDHVRPVGERWIMWWILLVILMAIIADGQVHVGSW